MAVIGTNGFWSALDDLVSSSSLIVDRPAGSAHPRYPAYTYPIDYGYLEGTSAGDRCGIDVWIGSQAAQGVTGLVCAVDLQKRDVEIKILLGCTANEARVALGAHNSGTQAGLLVERERQNSPSTEPAEQAKRPALTCPC